MKTANNFTVEATLPALKFDYGSLRKWVEDITSKYKGLVVRPAAPYVTYKRVEG
ncbi:MAG: hypothetical protein AB7D47_13055 [Desulfovibrio sp.]